jgi:hypothetical protein
MESDCGCGGGWQPDPYIGQTHATWCPMYSSLLEEAIEKLQDTVAEIQAWAESWQGHEARAGQSAVLEILGVLPHGK